MTKPDAARAFLLAEVESLEPFDFVAAIPSGRPLHMVEVARTEEGRIEVTVAGRPPGFPPLEESERVALTQLGFESSDASEPKNPWVLEAADGQTAVKKLQEVINGVFGEEPDAHLDVAHGNHRARDEAMKKLASARSRIETIVTDILGQKPEQDGDSDFVLPIEGVHVTVAARVTPEGQVVIRVFCITNVGVAPSGELGLFLARLNFGRMFGRFTFDAIHQSVWFDETLLGEQFREEELRFAIHLVASTSDEWDDRLKQMFGGVTYQDVLTGKTQQAPPTTKPGEGVGQYL